MSIKQLKLERKRKTEGLNKEFRHNKRLVNLSAKKIKADAFAAIMIPIPYYYIKVKF